MARAPGAATVVAMPPATEPGTTPQRGQSARELRRLFHSATERSERQQRARQQLAERPAAHRRDRRMLSFHRPNR